MRRLPAGQVVEAQPQAATPGRLGHADAPHLNADPARPANLNPKDRQDPPVLRHVKPNPNHVEHEARPFSGPRARANSPVQVAGSYPGSRTGSGPGPGARVLPLRPVVGERRSGPNLSGNLRLWRNPAWAWFRSRGLRLARPEPDRGDPRLVRDPGVAHLRLLPGDGQADPERFPDEGSVGGEVDPVREDADLHALSVPGGRPA